MTSHAYPDLESGPDPAVALQMRSVGKTYRIGKSQIAALSDLSMSLRAGSFTAVMGPSGSGKTTFLHCAAGLDRPTSGSVQLAGVDLGTLGEDALCRLRRERIGFVFQAFNLVAALTVMQNVSLPLRLARARPDKAWLDDVVCRVGLAERSAHRPAELSGGQQQRVAIARALITRPEVIFADEPTGALDTRTGREILELLREAVSTLGQTVVMVTHDPVAAAYADSVVLLADGRLLDVMHGPTADRVAARMTHLEA